MTKEVEEFGKEMLATFERALQSENGIFEEWPTHKEAKTRRARLNRFRKSEREESKLVYPEGHIMWGKTPYDDLELTIETQGEEWDNILIIRKRPAPPVARDMSEHPSEKRKLTRKFPELVRKPIKSED